MGPSLPPVPASDERQENQVENYFKVCMQDINIFEEMAIKVFHREWAKGNTSSLFSITLCWLIFMQKNSTLFCPMENLNTSSQNKEKKSVLPYISTHTPAIPQNNN